ncbi:hypothetical protein [Lactococcus termiticola]|uniref:Uncharacterized protein n=1 Tax=Lactococcus termiticola TaxID=2169526 RepID=A0A2R5HDB0_9LACT|nr:hypothetical protein [Lactococcus termiticola]GBG96064.1 hypothetical protein NtB2_00167 [Lactococcus termiticola]
MEKAELSSFFIAQKPASAIDKSQIFPDIVCDSSAIKKPENML